jgi:hypothetical protein
MTGEAVLLALHKLLGPAMQLNGAAGQVMTLRNHLFVFVF